MKNWKEIVEKNTDEVVATEGGTYTIYKRAEGLVNMKARKAFLQALNTMKVDLEEEGFEYDEIMSYVIQLSKQVVK